MQFSSWLSLFYLSPYNCTTLFHYWLKEVRNYITRVIHLQSLFSSIQVYVSLSFLPILFYLVFRLWHRCYFFRLYNVCLIILYVKSVQIRSYFCSVFSCIQTEYREIRTRNNYVFGHFSWSDCLYRCQVL